MSTGEAEDRPKLHFWDAYWDHRPAECPCDEDFIRWIDEMRIRDAAIYHFGTGGHHHVGIECAMPERRNAVLGITAAPQEHATYIELAIERPDVLRYYNCVFGDIYLLNRRLLPDFDVVTLFHLCEFRGPKNDAYGGSTDLEVTRLLTDKLRPGGHILFFPGSFAWDRANDSAKDVVAEWEISAGVTRVGTFRSLLVYRKTA
ncbi:hypothetical protein [Enterovirga rhinocerotis]|uniref:Methyltransferase family protein n=1 Tax=Enterovirga rhinocerotis TaxID=1339210 RepID=A0A4R7BTE7_9HYPH|nr:hypothetical protein [Enterovirga rhinocerotis]TDR89018.1 hypothetical protein EV668_3503 [Enterovirga rhinocerotis]